MREIELPLFCGMGKKTAPRLKISIMDANRSSRLHSAVKTRRIDLIEKILREGLPVDALDRDGNTALKYAVFYDYLPGVRMLVEARADVNRRLPDGNQTVLHMAVRNPSNTCMQFLIRAGANIDIEDEWHDTPLTLAILYDKVKTAELLLDRGARISAVYRCPWFKELPSWVYGLAAKRKRCRDAVAALYGVLRKRYRVVNTRIPRDMVRLLANYTRATRFDEGWEDQSRPVKKK